MSSDTKEASSSPIPAASGGDAPSPAAPVFGAASTFGAGSGFAGFTGVTTAAGAAGAAAPAADGEDAAAAGGEAGGEADPEEECTADFQPVVQLQEVETVSGEEAEDAWVDFKSKLYRFDHGGGEWKERGVGQTRLLRHKVTDRVRLLFRQEKTLKVRANHIVMPGTKLAPHAGSDKAVVWSAVDFSEGEQATELFCLRFASPERAAEFTAKFEEAVAHNAKVLGEAAGGVEEEGEGEGGEGEGEASASKAGSATASASAADTPAKSAADELAGEVAAKATVVDDEAESGGAGGAAKADE